MTTLNQLNSEIEATKTKLEVLTKERDEIIRNGIGLSSTRLFNYMEQAFMNKPCHSKLQYSMSDMDFVKNFRILKLDVARQTGKTKACLRLLSSIPSSILITRDLMQQSNIIRDNKEHEFQIHSLNQFRISLAEYNHTFKGIDLVIFDEVKYSQDLISLWMKNMRDRDTMFIFVGTGII